MSTQPHSRSKRDRINRLRVRAQRMAQEDPRLTVAAGILLGILDLLEDEL